MARKNIYSNTVIEEIQDGKGNIKEKRVTTNEFAKEIDTEPGYIKLYVDMWCALYDVPANYKNLLIQLAIYMTPVDCNDLDSSQIVGTTGPMRNILLKACGWKSYDSLQLGLKALCNCGAIRRVSNGWYQVNPSFAARGKWLDARNGEDGKYTGLKNFRFVFDVMKGNMSTSVTYSEEDQ